MTVQGTAFQEGSSFVQSGISNVSEGASFFSGAATAGITGGIGIALALGMGALARHEQRYKDATNENAAVQQAIQVFDNDIKTIIAAANAGTITTDEAKEYLQQTHDFYFQYMSGFQGQPGVASRPCADPSAFANKNACFHGGKCDKGCTAGCCVGCNVVNGAIANAIYALDAGGGDIWVCPVFPSPKYKNPGRPGYHLKYKKPDIVAGTEGAVDAFFNQFGLGNLFGSGANTPKLAGNLQPVTQTRDYVKYAVVALAALFVIRRVF